VQLHGFIKSNLKATLKEIDAVLLGSIAACGDVNRNVMCNPNPEQSRAHAERITGGEEGVTTGNNARTDGQQTAARSEIAAQLGQASPAAAESAVHHHP
jgi:sulfite reductase beta subunit-like hemoprotein